MRRVNPSIFLLLILVVVSMVAASPKPTTLEDATVLLDKRTSCSADSGCAKWQYCSTKRFQCFRKLEDNHHCSRDYACFSGYCSTVSNMCREKRKLWQKCRKNNAACKSGYCGIYSHLCEPKVGKGKTCAATAQCKHHLSCVNSKCVSATPTGVSKRHDIFDYVEDYE